MKKNTLYLIATLVAIILAGLILTPKKTAGVDPSALPTNGLVTEESARPEQKQANAPGNVQAPVTTPVTVPGTVYSPAPASTTVPPPVQIPTHDSTPAPAPVPAPVQTPVYTPPPPAGR